MNSISYIVTVYNKASALPEVIRSLKAQEGDFEREYIFVDDGSTDDSLDVIKTLCPDAVIISQANQGPSVAVNVGLKMATKQWIYLVDGDDCLYPNATQTLLDVALEYDSKIVCGRHSNNPSKDAWRFDGSIQIHDDPLRKALQFYTLGASTTIIDRELVVKVGGCDERVFVQDYSLALRLSRLANKFVSVNKLISHNVDAGQKRLSGNKLQENHDTAAARYLFVRDNLDISYEYKYLVLRLFLRKAFKWHLRHGGVRTIWSKHMWRYLVSMIDLGFDDENVIGWMKEGLEVYQGEVRS